MSIISPLISHKNHPHCKCDDPKPRSNDRDPKIPQTNDPNRILMTGSVWKCPKNFVWRVEVKWKMAEKEATRRRRSRRMARFSSRLTRSGLPVRRFLQRGEVLFSSDKERSPRPALSSASGGFDGEEAAGWRGSLPTNVSIGAVSPSGAFFSVGRVFGFCRVCGIKDKCGAWGWHNEKNYNRSLTASRYAGSTAIS